MKQAFLDTNILARFLIGDVQSQQIEVEKIFERGTNLEYEYSILPEIMLELNYVMSRHYEFEKEQIVDGLKNLLDLHFIKLHETYSVDFKKTLDKYAHFNISLEDCLYLQFCQENNLELITFDKKLQNAWKKMR